MGVPTPSRNIVEGELLWTPSAAFAHNSQLARFERWLGEHRALCFADYDALWRWTITDPDAYWSAFLGVLRGSLDDAVRFGALGEYAADALVLRCARKFHRAPVAVRSDSRC